MSDNIIEFESKMPHKVSETICIKCGYRCIDVRPASCLLKDLECAGCHKIGFIIETGQELEETK